MARADSTDGHPTLGMPDDPGKTWDEMVEQVSAEFEARKRKGLPIPKDLREAVRDKLGKDI